MMQEQTQAFRCQLILLAMGLALASIAGVECLLAALAAGLAILLPELMQIVLGQRMMREVRAGKLVNVFRARLLKFATTVVLLAVSVNTIAAQTAAVVTWITVVVMLTLAPGLYLLWAPTGIRAGRIGRHG